MDSLKPKYIYIHSNKNSKNNRSRNRLLFVFFISIIAIFAIGRIVPVLNISSIHKINITQIAHSDDGGGDGSGDGGGDAGGDGGGDSSGDGGGDTGGDGGGDASSDGGGDMGGDGGGDVSSNGGGDVDISSDAGGDVIPTPTNLLPACTLTLNPSAILLNETSTLSWISSDAISGNIQPGIGNVGLTGSRIVSPTSTTIYSGIFINDFSSSSCQTTLVVNLRPLTPPSPILSCSISASPSSITQGANSTLSWLAENASSTTIDNSIGNVSSTGSMVVSPANTTIYTMTAINSSSTVNCNTTITVSSPGGGGGGGGGGGVGYTISPAPTAVLTTFRSEPSGQVLGVVTLAQVPYTGFSDNLNTTLFILILLFGSGILASRFTFGKIRTTSSKLIFHKVPFFSKKDLFESRKIAVSSIFISDNFSYFFGSKDNI